MNPEQLAFYGIVLYAAVSTFSALRFGWLVLYCFQRTVAGEMTFAQAQGQVLVGLASLLLTIAILQYLSGRSLAS